MSTTAERIARIDQETQGVDFFGGDAETAWVGKKAAGRLLDGVLHDAYTEARS